MTDKQLEEANDLKKEIQELDLFIHSAERVWTGEIIKRDTNYIIKSTGYGCVDSVEFNMNTDIKNKVLNVLRIHLLDLKDKLKNI